MKMPEPIEHIFAACNPGLEPILANELSSLGLDAHAVAGGADASGQDAVARACIASRMADAVFLRLYQGEPRGLRDSTRVARRRFGDEAPLVVRRHGGDVTLSLDAVGSPLYKRGWRQRIGAAPLRETLAAGILLSCGYDGNIPLLDPMCGSGTIAIEAALIASRRAPGIERSFAFESWPGHDASRTAALRRRFRALERTVPVPIYASDRNAGALRLAAKNAEAAGVATSVRFERVDAAEVSPPSGPGLCAVNPPYGVRLEEEVEAAWQSLATLADRLVGWTLCVLAPDEGFADLLGHRPANSFRVKNGGLSCAITRMAL